MPHARRLLSVLWVARLAISRRAPLPRRRWGAASSAVATPRASPGPPTPVHQLARPTEMPLAPSPPSGPTRCHKPGRAEAVAKGVNAARGHFLAHRSVEGGSATDPRSSLGVTRLLQCLGGLRSRSDFFRCLSPPWSGGGGC